MSNIMAFSYDSRPIQTIINQIKNVNKRRGNISDKKLGQVSKY